MNLVAKLKKMPKNTQKYTKQDQRHSIRQFLKHADPEVHFERFSEPDVTNKP